MRHYPLSLFGTVLLTGLSCLLLSCEEPEEAVDPTPPLTFDNVSEEVRQQFASLGFEASDLAMSGENYLVGGDILVTPASLAEMLATFEGAEGPQEEQFRTNIIVNARYKTIKIRLMNEEDKRLAEGIRRAIDNYNNLGLRFKLKRVPASDESAHIKINRVRNLDRDFGVIGSAFFPAPGGVPGDKIVIDRIALYSDRSNNFIEHLVTHEIGHCLGMRHSDWFDKRISCGRSGSESAGSIGAIMIAGTKNRDPKSIMNSCWSGNTGGEFTSLDKVAWRKVY